MAERVRIPLVFSGLERPAGLLSVDPTKMRDLRNVHVGAGRLSIRRGMQQVSALTGQSITDVVAIQALRAERTSIIAGYASSTRQLHVYRADSTAVGPAHLGQWATLPVDTPAPRATSTESYGKIFLAHEERLPGRRAPTTYFDLYDPAQLRTLQADLRGQGLEPVRFAGVTNYLNYLVGWGFGTAVEYRPEIIRVSRPGEPHVFQADDYFIAGQRGEPVTSCVPAGSVLLAFKASETYAVTGYDETSFGIHAIDPRFGCPAARLAINHGGACFFWSLEGPRVSSGEASEDLSLPLDLGGPRPDDLVEEGLLEYGFAAYLPEWREIKFFFGRHVYSLSLRIPGKPEWSYDEIGRNVACAGLLFDEAPEEDPPTGTPTFMSVAPSPTTALVTWQNVASYGDEIVEIWLRPGGGVWALHGGAGVTDVTQTALVAGLQTATVYDVALRYRRGGLYGVGYTSGNPINWPPTSLGSFTTTLAVPTFTSAVWERTSGSVERAVLTIAPINLGLNLQIYRDGTLRQTVSPPHSPTIAFNDTTVTGEALHEYKARSIDGTIPSPFSNAISTWMGPAPGPTGLHFTQTPSGGSTVHIGWTNGDDSYGTEILSRKSGDPDFSVVTTASAGVSQLSVSVPVTHVLGALVHIKVRHTRTQFSVTDRSQDSGSISFVEAGAAGIGL